MTFDIIVVTEDELKEYSSVQMQLLRTAQKKKDELQHRMESDLAMFKKAVYTDGMKNSTLYEQKKAELQAEFDYRVDILREQLVYSLELNEPFPDGDESAGYIVDYSLSYTERYNIVKQYYLSIDDTTERMHLYLNDDVARRYLGSYYTTLYNVLYTYSM